MKEEIAKRQFATKDKSTVASIILLRPKSNSNSWECSIIINVNGVITERKAYGEDSLQCLFFGLKMAKVLIVDLQNRFNGELMFYDDINLALGLQ